MAFEAELTVGVGKSKLVHLEVKLIKGKVLPCARCCHRIRLKQNRVLYRVSQQKTDRTNIGSDVDQCSPRQVLPEEKYVLAIGDARVQNPGRHRTVRVSDKPFAIKK